MKTRVLKYYKSDSIRVFQILGSDLALAYKLKEAAKCFGDEKQQKNCNDQFVALKNAMEVLARFHSVIKISFSKSQTRKIIEEILNL